MSVSLLDVAMSCLRGSCSFSKTTTENYPKEKRADALDRKGEGCPGS